VSPRSSEFLNAARRRLAAAEAAATEDPSTALSAAYYAMLYGARAARAPDTRGHWTLLSQLKGALRTERDVRLAVIFGSTAVGEDHLGSDVDLLIELEPGRTLLDLATFRRRAADILGVPVDVATPDMLKEHIRREGLAQAQPL
jgi:uncharacterized protein